MKTYCLTQEAKIQILKDNNLPLLMDFEMENSSDSEFFMIVHFDLKIRDLKSQIDCVESDTEDLTPKQ